ncbi:hypothetical protein ABGT15_13080, partial [Flavobacterium enshiense]|uniref:hypothetical protein n=1 Tax=Flavobacterium enshiense TaxID=1341165 RepID=UPI00345CF306
SLIFSVYLPTSVTKFRHFTKPAGRYATYLPTVRLKIMNLRLKYFFLLLISLKLCSQEIDMKHNENLIDREFISKDLSQVENDSSQKILIFIQQSANSDYEIFLKNNSIDTLSILLQDESIKIIQEAKDQKGNWKPIEYWKSAWCGNSYYTEKIAPYVTIKSISKSYSGNFTTLIRFKLLHNNKNYFSNEIAGNVNLSQFKLTEKMKLDSGITGEAFRIKESTMMKYIFLEVDGAKDFMNEYNLWVEARKKKYEKSIKK